MGDDSASHLKVKIFEDDNFQLMVYEKKTNVRIKKALITRGLRTKTPLSRYPFYVN